MFALSVGNYLYWQAIMTGNYLETEYSGIFVHSELILSGVPLKEERAQRYKKKTLVNNISVFDLIKTV